MPLAVSALRDLDQVYDLFTNMGEKARAAKVLVSQYRSYEGFFLLKIFAM